ncbi:Arsj [Symbiodinium pilosum]|uniref:Arsj protein n=1 Tax=Symbiodinium pilosum TaxID=2952 RepID=A0A812J9Q3_SYMPI|nr:Arsj [Symbiodinium pilosum]
MRSALLLLAVVQVATSEASVSEAFAVDFLQRRLEIGKELKRPNILLFIADDQGWAGLGAHRTDKGEEEAQGKAETQTPTMDNLIREGILLERHYTSSQSAPARSSLLSGRLPSHCWPGKPEGVSNAQMFWNRSDNVSGFLGIPRNMTAFPRKLQEVGYATHYVGKWDAGYATPEHTPLGRGYDSFLGFLQGGIDAWTKGHGKVTDDVVLDVCLNKFRDFSLYNASYRARVGHQVARELGCNVRASLGKPLFVNATGCLDSNISLCWPESCYADEMLLKYAAKIIRTHDSKKQLFLTYASRSVHSAMEVPAAYMQRLDDMVAQTGVARALPWTLQRKEMAALQLHMDTVLGKLILAFKDKGMYDNLLIVYLSDNGGGVNLYENGNNYPLKSGKYTDWEGGVRTNAFIGGGAVPVEKRGSTFNGVIHISDWYATLCTLAGADYVDHAAEEANKILRAQQLPLLAPVDSRPQWQHIMLGTSVVIALTAGCRVWFALDCL